VTRARSALALVETAYRPTDTESTWLDGLATAGKAALDQGLGVMAYTFGLDGRGRFALGTLTSRNARSRSVATMVLATRLSKQRDLRRIYFETSLCSTLSEYLGAEHLRRDRLARIHGALTGIADFLAVRGIDAGRRGVALGVFLPKLRRLSDAEREPWEQVGAHLAAAYRLQVRRTLRRDGLPEGTEAVLEPAGAVLHAEGEAQRSRDVLTQTARRIDRARVDGDEAALELWPALVEGRWSLVDHFEADGRRFVVARSNVAEVAPRPSLTARETQVVAHSARGHSLKLIGYELGISESTVRTLEARAMKKLGVASRMELIALVRATA
jgi:DNA-binding CsgD family transcriptional regulator